MSDFRTLYDQLMQFNGGTDVDSVPSVNDAQSEYQAVVERELVKKGYLLLARRAALRKTHQRVSEELAEVEEQFKSLPGQFSHTLVMKNGQKIDVNAEPGRMFQEMWAEIDAPEPELVLETAPESGESGDTLRIEQDESSIEQVIPEIEGVPVELDHSSNFTPEDPLGEIDLSTMNAENEFVTQVDSNVLPDLSAVKLDEIDVNFTKSSSSAMYYDSMVLSQESDELLDYL